MEHELRQNLLSTAGLFAGARSIALSTVGRLAAGDWKFFDRLAGGETSFTARKYDEVMQWFSDHWPDGADWPETVARPERSAAIDQRTDTGSTSCPAS